MEKWLIWCDLNVEQDALEKIFTGFCVSVRGGTPSDKKEEYLERWLNEDVPIMISKPSIFGHGLNFQNCSNVIFAGLSDSQEAYYQAVRRCWRFGQKNIVNVYIILSDKEVVVLDNIKRKESQAEKMVEGMLFHMKEMNRETIHENPINSLEYNPRAQMIIPEWLT